MTAGLKTAAERRRPAAAHDFVAAIFRGAVIVSVALRWRSTRALLPGVAATLVAIEAAAIGLGPATVSSGLGEPLRMSIPVTLQPDEDVGCVQVRPSGNDLPSVFNTRSQVLRAGGQTRIEIRSPAGVDEPAVGLVVSVGCASPVSRDYVLFLDPPLLAATEAAEALPPLSTPTRRTPRPPASASDASPDASSAAVASTDRTHVKRPARRRSTPVASEVAPTAATPRSLKADVAPAARGRAPVGGDRLSVVPTEPPVIGRTSRSPQPGVFPPPVSDRAGLPPSMTAPAASTPIAAASSPSGAAPVVAAQATPAGTAAASGEAAAPAAAPVDAAALAREEALRQQQAALQTQIKDLSDQIAALRVQATSLAVRNQALEGNAAFSPTLVWWLIALAAIAIVLAGWMAWRYTQLRRSLEGSAWWTSQTVGDGDERADSVASGAMARAEDAAPSIARPPLRPTARTAPRPPTLSDSLPEAPPQPFAPTSSAQISNVDRIRPPVRAPGSNYPAAMDTDFTVSDIEAAMATVRTVSPPRTEKATDPLHDSDFSGLAGQNFVSPFSEAPPSAVAAPTHDLQEAHFVDLDIPHIQPLAAAPPKTASSDGAPGASRPSDGSPGLPPTHGGRPQPRSPEQSFSLELPGQFDPLATDSMKTTIFDRGEPEAYLDASATRAPTELDFELPSQTQILAMAPFEQSVPREPVRHGATALHDLFAPASGIGHDTVLDLNDRDGTPLSGTEVDRLTTPPEGAIGVDDPTGRSRMAGFADLMTRVDDLAIADPLAAIAELRQYVLRDERIPTLLWLRLFELYKVVDKRPVYEALAEHFARRYHRPMVPWTQALADRTPQRPLSALTEIDRQIEAQWGTGAGALHLETLLCDRTQDDAIVFNAVLQADLLDAAKIHPVPADDGIEGGPSAAGAPG